MEQNQTIVDFLQNIYVKYDISDGAIAYGYNDVSETYIVRISDTNVMSNDDLQLDLFRFTQQMADSGIWVMFVSQEDSILLSDYHTVDREWRIVVASHDLIQQVYSFVFSDLGWKSSIVINRKNFTAGDSDGVKNKEYALAA